MDTFRFAEYRRAHLVGIAGAGMSALASLLLDLGWVLSGSDLRSAEPSIEMLKRRGVKIGYGHRAQNVSAGADLLIYSTAVPFENPERAAARAAAIPELSYGQTLGLLTRSRRAIGIAGTHGKSTTAALTAFLLRHSGRDPSACFGAVLCDGDAGGWVGGGDLLVVESCEYERTFLGQSPQFAAILNVEPDHFDCFDHFGDAVLAFAQFAGQVPENGLLVVSADCPAALQAAGSCRGTVETLSLNHPADWEGSDVEATPDGVRFQLARRGTVFGNFVMPVPGRHNATNAMAAIALAAAIGVDAESMRCALAAFPGIRRRFETGGSWRGVTLVDDYAHHPTAVRATLEATRSRYPGRRIWCVFQPHQISRTRALLAEFARSFALADEALLASVYAAREASGHEAVLLSQRLAGCIAQEGTRARFCPDLDRIVATLEDETRPGDVVLTMGAGDINRVHHALARRLSSNRAS